MNHTLPFIFLIAKNTLYLKIVEEIFKNSYLFMITIKHSLTLFV